jgi:hypothetical protein
MMTLTKEDVLLKSLREYYKQNPSDAFQLFCVISYKSDISLRVLDWLVTNYAKSHNIVYYTRGRQFNMHLQYKSSLKAFSKRAFDPFARRDRVVVHDLHPLDPTEALCTTVAQLNFFRWCFLNGVLAYAIKHVREITGDMVRVLSTRKRKRGKPKKTTFAAGKSMV